MMRTTRCVVRQVLDAEGTMTQAQVSESFGYMLYMYRDKLLRALHDTNDPEYPAAIPELMYNVLYFLARILERDLPHLKHDTKRCQCKESTAICFAWVIDLERLASDRLQRQLRPTPMVSWTRGCWLVNTMMKYKTACVTLHINGN